MHFVCKHAFVVLMVLTAAVCLYVCFLCCRIVFFLLYNNFIPISLYVSIELVNVGQAYLMGSDEEMYSEALDAPCCVRSSNLGQELGTRLYACMYV